MITDTIITDSVDDLQASESLTDVLAVVARLNGDIGADGITGDVLDRLKEWLRKLWQRLQDLLAGSNALAFSVAVGTHVTVTVTFATTPASQG